MAHPTFCIGHRSVALMCILLLGKTVGFYISGLHITNLSDSLNDAPIDTTILTINGTSIQILDSRILEERLQNLTYLSVKNNMELEQIVGKFNFSRLLSIELMVNSLSTLPSFSYCPGLLTYKVTGNANHLTHFNTLDITMCTNLKSIQIETSGLVKFPNFNELKTTNLEFIKLKGNNISDTDDSDLRGLHHLKEVYLNDNNLVTLPSLMDLTALEQFEAYGNSFENLTISSFYNMTYLKVLDLGTSKIFSHLPDLDPLASLRKLSLKLKPGTNMSGDYLDSMWSLKKLTLYNAHFTEPLRVAQSRHILREIKFYDCQVKLADGSFEGFEKLFKLWVNNGGLDNIPSLNASVLTLNSLHLNRNAISSIPINYFSKFTRLLTVKINHNDIETLSNLGSNITIKYFFLSYNHISAIDSDAFWGFCCLKNLDLRGNKLVTFDFKVPSLVETILLSYNSLTYMNGEILQRNKALIKVGMFGNQLTCDSRMCFLNNDPWASVFRLDWYPCHSPENLRSKTIIQVLAEKCLVIPNTNRVEYPSFTTYTCFPGLRFQNGYTKIRLSKDDVTHSKVKDTERKGCLEHSSMRRQDFVLANNNHYVEQTLTVDNWVVVLQKNTYEMPTLRSDLDCARLCSRTKDCVKFDGVDGRCNIYTAAP